MIDDESVCDSLDHYRLKSIHKKKMKPSGSPKFIVLGSAICLVALSVFVIWEHFRRTNENDTVAINNVNNSQNRLAEISVVDDAPPAYSSLFSIEDKKDMKFCVDSTEQISQSTAFPPSAPEMEIISNNIELNNENPQKISSNKCP